MDGGVKLKQNFGATGYAEGIRFTTDFASRMYFMEALPKEKEIEIIDLNGNLE